MQRRETATTRCERGARGNQQPENVDITVLCSEMTRRAKVFVERIHIDAGINQHRDNACLLCTIAPTFGGRMTHCLPACVDQPNVSAGSEQCLHGVSHGVFGGRVNGSIAQFVCDVHVGAGVDEFSDLCNRTWHASRASVRVL